MASKNNVTIIEDTDGIRLSTLFSVHIPSTVKDFQDAIKLIDEQAHLERQRIVTKAGEKFGIKVQWE